jgi:hypothetical protein
MHLRAVIPNLSFAADARHHHLTDDIIRRWQTEIRKTASLPYHLRRVWMLSCIARGAAQYRELARRLGLYAYDQEWQILRATVGQRTRRNAERDFAGRESAGFGKLL